jgi:hypothetical protein
LAGCFLRESNFFYSYTKIHLTAEGSIISHFLRHTAFDGLLMKPLHGPVC